MTALHIDDLTDAELTSLVGQDIPGLLAAQALRFPDKPFLVWEPFEGDAYRWTYAEFHANVERLAGALHGRGVTLGDRVLLHMADEHIGCALVVKDGRLAGIFTTTDACRVFSTRPAPGASRSASPRSSPT